MHDVAFFRFTSIEVLVNVLYITKGSDGIEGKLCKM